MEDERAFDLVLTDVIMPEMSGVDLYEKVLETWPGTKFLFMSGYSSNIITNNGKLQDNLAFIAKPFSMSELARKVREAIAKP